MTSQCLAKEERVVRAILENHYDEANNHYSSDLFCGENISLSRLSVKPYVEIVEVFLFELDKPKRAVVRTGEISVGELQQIGTEHIEKPLAITVMPKPEMINTAHAEVPQKISKGLAKKIIKGLDKKEINRNRDWRRMLLFVAIRFKALLIALLKRAKKHFG